MLGSLSGGLRNGGARTRPENGDAMEGVNQQLTGPLQDICCLYGSLIVSFLVLSGNHWSPFKARNDIQFNLLIHQRK